MTYEESYMQCKTLKELEDEVKKDIIFAQVFNTDRLKIIDEAAKKVAEEKFGINFIKEGK